MRRALFASLIIVCGLSSHSYAHSTQPSSVQAGLVPASTIAPQDYNWGTIGGVPAIWEGQENIFLLEDVDLEYFLSKYAVPPVVNAPVWTIEVVVLSREERLLDGNRTRAQLDDSTYLLIDKELALLEKQIETRYKGAVNIEFKKRVVITPFRHAEQTNKNQNLAPKLKDWIGAQINQADWEDAKGIIQKAPFAGICLTPFTKTQTLRSGIVPVEGVAIYDIADDDRLNLRERLSNAWQSISALRGLELYGNSQSFSSSYSNGWTSLVEQISFDNERIQAGWTLAAKPKTASSVIANPLLAKTMKVPAPIFGKAIQLTRAGDKDGNRLWIDERLLSSNPKVVESLDSRFAFAGGIPEKTYLAFNPSTAGESVNDVVSWLGASPNSGPRSQVQSRAHGRFKITNQKFTALGLESLDVVIGPGDATGWVDVPVTSAMATLTGTLLVEFEVKNTSPEFFGIRMTNRDRTVVRIPALARNLKPVDAEWVTVKMAVSGPLNPVKPMQIMASTVLGNIWEPITGIDRELSIKNLKVSKLTGEVPIELAGPSVDPIEAYKKRVENQTPQMLIASEDRELQIEALKILKSGPVDTSLLPQIVELAKAGDFSLSLSAMQTLLLWNAPELTSAVKYALTIGPYETNRQVAAMIVAEKNMPEFVRSITALMVSPDVFTRLWACKALANQTDIDSLAALTLMLGDPDPGVRFASAAALKSRNKLAGSKLIYAAVNDPSELVRAQAYKNLIVNGPANLLPEALRGRSDESWVVRKEVVFALAESKLPGSLDLVKLAGSDRNLQVRRAAIMARKSFVDTFTEDEMKGFDQETHPMLLLEIRELFSSRNLPVPEGVAAKLKELGQ